MKSIPKKPAFVVSLVLLLPLFVAGQQLSQREQFDQLLAKLQQNPSDQDQREQVIRFCASMLPQPAVPEEARKAYIEGMTLHQDAKSPTDEKVAVDSYRRGLALAPWWGDLYLGMAVSQELSGDLQGAITSLNDYLLSSPPPDKARNAQDHIYMLDAKLKEVNASQQATNQVLESRRKLSGLWLCKTGCQGYMRVDSDGNDFHVNMGGFKFDGHFDGDAVTGLVAIPVSPADAATGCAAPEQTHHMTAYIENNATTIRLQYESNSYIVNWHKVPDTLLGWLSPHVVCDVATVTATMPLQAELTGGPKRPYLGLQVRTITPGLAAASPQGPREEGFKQGFRQCGRQRKTNTAGAIVAAVEANSPAAAAGLKAGDVINVQKGGGLFCTAEEIVNYVQGIVPNAPYELEFYTGDRKPQVFTLRNEAVNAY
jgi:hypothetical protein